jgi:hypothetical protein
MKTTQEVQREIDGLRTQFKDEKNRNDKFYKKAGKRIEFLNFVKAYLDTNPTQETVSKQLELCELRTKKIADGYGYWLKYDYKQAIDGTNPIKVWGELNNEKKLKKQITTLKFILA